MGHGLAASLAALVRAGRGAGGAGPAGKKRTKTTTSVKALQRQARRVAADRDREKRAEVAREADGRAAKEAARREAAPDTALLERYDPRARTLVVGDGNLSFALALARSWTAAAKGDAGADDGTAVQTGAADADHEGDAAQREEADLADPEGDPAHEDGDDNANASPRPAARLIATVFDSAENVVAKYPEAASNAAALVALGATVAYGVDGTQLGSPSQVALHGCRGELGGLADVVAFHFPHVGLGIKDQDRNIRENQKLLQGFFASVLAVLAPGKAKAGHQQRRRRDDDDDDNDEEHGGRHGRGRVDARRPGMVTGPSARDVGDGGGEVHVTVRRGEPYDSWHVVKLARAAGLALVNAVAFDPRVFPGYEHRRTLGTVEGVSHLHNEEILPKHCVTYIFQRMVVGPAPAKPHRR